MNLAQPFPLQAPAPVGTVPTAIRPYAVTGARMTPFRASGAGTAAPRPVYDPATQTASLPDGTPLTTMATSVKTNPDGDPGNPPPHDEGADPGVFE